MHKRPWRFSAVRGWLYASIGAVIAVAYHGHDAARELRRVVPQISERLALLKAALPLAREGARGGAQGQQAAAGSSSDVRRAARVQDPGKGRSVPTRPRAESRREKESGVKSP
jgi:hypothetical protein